MKQVTEGKKMDRGMSNITRALRQPLKEVSSSPASIVPLKYGELTILGYNDFVPDEEEARRKTHFPSFTLYQRPKANGVKPSTVHKVCNQEAAKALSNLDQYSTYYTLSHDSTVVVQYTPASNTDMFQIGRSKESPIDWVLMDDPPLSKSVVDTISRFACRIICQRSPPYTTHIYAAGFDSSKNIFLGENAVKWKTPDGQMDGLTTNGLLVMYPLHGVTRDSKPGLWREISVCGNVYTRRDTPSAQRGRLVDSGSQELVDGSLIDLCGLTLLWRTAEGLARMPTLEAPWLERYGRARGPVVSNNLPSPSLRCKEVMDAQSDGRPVCAALPSLRCKEVKVRPEGGAGILRDPQRGTPLFAPPVCMRAGENFWELRLQRDVCELTLDPNTAHIKISLSENNKKVTRVEMDQRYLDNPDRFKDYGQVMCKQSLTGLCYWEVEWSGGVDIAVTYKGINRQGDDSQFGYNDKSWSLRCSGGENSYTVWHNKKKTNLPVSPSSRSGRVAVNVDWPAGTVSFYTVSSDTLTHLHTFQSTFTEPLYAGFWVGWSDSSVCVCQREKVQ